MSPQRWRRGDGSVLSPTDLIEAVPMLRHELDDIIVLVDLLEEWLRLDQDAADLLSDWRTTLSGDPAHPPTTQAILDELGALSVRLHHLLRAHAPGPARAHPLTT